MRYIILFVFTSLVLVSCNNTSTTNTENKNVTVQQISEMEDELFSSSMSIPDAQKAENLVNMYIDFANQNPNNPLSPDYLFKAADISMNFRAPKKSVSLFNRIINNYPDYKNIATAMFLKGFVYEDQIQDYTMARKSYMEFLERFPNNEFSDDARVSLQNLGKTPEELIKEFEKNN